jgi:cyclase
VITVKNGWAVQSFGYERHLPLGRPEVLAANLDRWGADEILLQCIDRSASGLGPDLELLERVAASGLSTPLIYSGGIRSVDDAVATVRAGADRVCVDALLYDDIAIASELGGPLGAQAILAALPVSSVGGELAWYDYRSGETGSFSPELLDRLKSGAVSEALIIDHRNEGKPAAFDPALVEIDLGLPLIAFGGISEPEQIAGVLQRDNVVAVGIGNFLNYREHAVQAYRAALDTLPLRDPIYERPLGIS